MLTRFIYYPQKKLFLTGSCQKTKCNKLWCSGKAFGFTKQDLLYIGFSSTFKDLSTSSPSVHVNFYRNESLKWHLAESATFVNNAERKVHLLGNLVHASSSAKHKRGTLQSSQWEYVTFKAKITKTTNKVLYQVLIFLFFLVCTVSYDNLFFLLQFMAPLIMLNTKKVTQYSIAFELR